MPVTTNNTLGKTFFEAGKVPRELEIQLFETFRQKLPAEIEDDVIRDIMLTNLEIVKNYFISQQS